MKKKVVTFRGIPVHEDPNAPTGMVYLVSEKWGNANAIIDLRSRWQMVKDSIFKPRYSLFDYVVITVIVNIILRLLGER